MDDDIEAEYWASPVETDHVLVKNWTTIKRKIINPILGNLPAHVKDDIQAVHLLRWGRWADATRN